MQRKPQGEFDTVPIKSAWIAARADGRRALIFENPEGTLIAFELPDELVRKLAADLATLSALLPPPKKPNT